MPREEPSKLPWIVLGGLALALVLVIVWEEVRHRGAADEIARLNGEVSQTTLESRRQLAAIELSAHAYRVEADRLREELAQATADRPLDHLRQFSDAQDLEQCRKAAREVFDLRVMPLSRRACSAGKPDPSLQAVWKAFEKDAAEWLEFFRARFPGFGPQCFEAVKVDGQGSAANTDISSWPELQSLIDAYCVISPDRRAGLYLDYPTGQPDSSVRLWDLAGKRERWRLDCGPGCHWDYAFWTGPESAVVVGLAESYFPGLPILTPEIRLLEIKDGKVKITGGFRGPDVDVSASGRNPSYSDLHRQWLTRRGMSRPQ